MTYQSEFLNILAERGFFNQCTDVEALDKALAAGSVTAYIGFDATADSLHVGHLLSIMTLRWLQKTGHRPIVLLGGGTTLIGDPSFRDTTRPLLDDAQIAKNAEGIRQVFDKYLAFGDGPNGAVMLNNADWLKKLNYLEFLRDYGRLFSVNRMLSFDSVKMRLEREQPLTFLEFNYMLLQAYDFMELSRTHGCSLQIGGSDQWGNIVNGIELARRVNGKELIGLTTPLMTTSSGAKMGKSAGGAVWLNADKRSPYDFWQYWRNTEDADVPRFLRIFTELPLDEVARLSALQGAELNEAKKILATEVTKLAHGERAALEAAETARAAFELGQSAGLPEIGLDAAAVAAGMTVVDAVVAAKLASSKSDARRLIENGGVKVNDVPVGGVSATLDPNAFAAGEAIKLSVGKKRHVLLKAN